MSAYRDDVGYFPVINTQRLDDTREPVAKMGCEQEEPNDVKQRNQWMFEPEYQHPVNIVTPERIMHLSKFRICYLDGELQEMINHETEDDQPAYNHRSRGHG